VPTPPDRVDHRDVPRILVTAVLCLCAALWTAPATQAVPLAKKKTVTVCKTKTVRNAKGKKKTVRVCWKKKVAKKAAPKATPAAAAPEPAPVAPVTPPATEPDAPAPGGLRGGLRDCANNERAKAGLGPLRDNAILDIAAQAHALDMKVRNYFSHESPGGKSPFDRIDALFNGINPFSWMGENIAKGFEDAESVCEGWMNSPGHRANILRPQFDSIGTGWVDGYAAQEFGGR
jgi:uncharacterized protein YkwD